MDLTTTKKRPLEAAASKTGSSRSTETNNKRKSAFPIRLTLPASGLLSEDYRYNLEIKNEPSTPLQDDAANIQDDAANIYPFPETIAHNNSTNISTDCSSATKSQAIINNEIEVPQNVKKWLCLQFLRDLQSYDNGCKNKNETDFSKRHKEDLKYIKETLPKLIIEKK